jgi:cytidyltransferase-like protein
VPGGEPIVIVPSEQLAGLAGAVTLVDGGFDPLHPGHIDYFREAAALGLPVLCNVSSDAWVGRKHPPLLYQQERGWIIDAIRYVAYTHLSTASTAKVLCRLRPRIYAKGADWRDRLPTEERTECERHEIEIVFLDTVTGSSSAILERYERSRSTDG